MKKCFKTLKKVFCKIGKIIQQIYNIVRKYILSIKKFFSGSMQQGFKIIHEIPWYLSIFILVVNFIIGLLILYFNHRITYFFMHLVCLTLNAMITNYIGKKYVNVLIFLDKEITEKHISENVELKILYSRFRKYAMCRCNILVCMIVLAIFFWGIISQQYIKADIVGFYAIFVVTVTVSISVIGYMQYLWMLWFLYRVSKSTTFHFNKNAPAHTPFLVEISGLLETAKWCFFLEGFLYVFEYYILIPKGQISFQKLNMPNNTSFLISWFVLFVVIILAFPIIILVQESLMSKIVDHLKNERVQLLSQEFDMVDNSQTTDKFMYNAMIKNILTSADYPVKNQRFGPALVSLATFCLHFVTFFSQIPSLNYLFQLIGF